MQRDLMVIDDMIRERANDLLSAKHLLSRRDRQVRAYNPPLLQRPITLLRSLLRSLDIASFRLEGDRSLIQ
jgi:hypothetical protein